MYPITAPFQGELHVTIYPITTPSPGESQVTICLITTPSVEIDIYQEVLVLLTGDIKYLYLFIIRNALLLGTIVYDADKKC